MTTVLEPMGSDSKPIWQSKTFWISAVTALVPLVFPPAGVWIAANPQLFSAALGVVFTGLRVVSKDRVTIR